MRALGMTLIVKLILFYLGLQIIVASTVKNQLPTFAVTDPKLYVLVVTLSTQDNTKLLWPLKLEFKRTINWNKYQSRVTVLRWNQYLDYLYDYMIQDFRE